VRWSLAVCFLSTSHMVWTGGLLTDLRNKLCEERISLGLTETEAEVFRYNDFPWATKAVVPYRDWKQACPIPKCWDGGLLSGKAPSAPSPGGSSPLPVDSTSAFTRGDCGMGPAYRAAGPQCGIPFVCAAVGPLCPVLLLGRWKGDKSGS
jgi:hypothetical protein